MYKIEKLINNLHEQKDSEEIKFVGSFTIDDNIKRVCLNAAKLRLEVSEYIKEIHKIDKYKREGRELKIELQAMLSEISLSKYLFSLSKEVRKDREKLGLVFPGVSDIAINKSHDDYILSFNNKSVSFDMKSQFINNYSKFIRINVEASERFEKNGSDFYMICLIDGNIKQVEKEWIVDLSSVHNVYYYLMSKKFFEKNRVFVDRKETNSSAHYKISLDKFRF